MTGTIRTMLAVMIAAIFFIALYDLFHPNSHPSLGAGIVVVAAVLLVISGLRVKNLPRPRSMKRAMLILFSVGFLLRLIVILAIPNRQVSDFQIYHELAATLSEGKGFAYDGPAGLAQEAAPYLHQYGVSGPLPTAFRMPGTPLIVGFLYTIGGPYPVFAKLFNALLGALTGVFLLRLMWMNNPCRAFWAGVIWEIYPSPWFNTTLVGTEIPFTFGVVLIAALFAKMAREYESDARHSITYALSAGLAAGGACLIRPSTQLVLCMVVAAIWQFWETRRSRPSWKKPLYLIALLIAGFALPLAAYGFRNYRTFGIFEWQPTEIGFNFLIMTRDIISPREERSLDGLSDAFYKSRDEFEISRLAREIGIKRLCIAASHPAFVKTLAKNFTRGWKNDIDGLSWCIAGIPGHESDRMRWGVPGALSIFIFLRRAVEAGYLALIALSFFGIIRTPWREIQNPGVLMMLLYFFGTCLLLCVFQGACRFHFPMIPFFCVCAAFSIGKGRILNRTS